MKATLATLGELEVLDCIGHVRLGGIDPGLLECLVQQPARGTHERLSLAVLTIAGLLADQHQLGPRRTGAEHGLGGGPPQRARSAIGTRGAQPRQGRLLG